MRECGGIDSNSGGSMLKSYGIFQQLSGSTDARRCVPPGSRSFRQAMSFADLPEPQDCTDRHFDPTALEQFDDDSLIISC
jgi:hypothetical protein